MRKRIIQFSMARHIPALKGLYLFHKIILTKTLFKWHLPITLVCSLYLKIHERCFMINNIKSAWECTWIKVLLYMYSDLRVCIKLKYIKLLFQHYAVWLM